MCENFVDDNTTYFRRLVSVICAGRAARGGARAPGAFISPGIWFCVKRVCHHEREIHAVCDSKPVVAVLEIVDYRACCVQQLDSFAAVVQAAEILTDNIKTLAVLVCESFYILDDQDVLAGGKVFVAEGKVHPVGKADVIEIYALRPDIFQFDELSIRVGWIVHNLRNPQILGDRAYCKNRLVQGAPVVAA